MAANPHHLYVSTDTDSHVLIHPGSELAKGYRIPDAESYYSFRDRTVPRLARIYKQTTALTIAWMTLACFALIAGTPFLTHVTALSIVWSILFLSPWCIMIWSSMMHSKAYRQEFNGLEPGQPTSLHLPILDNAARRLPWPTLVTCFAFTMLLARVSVGLLMVFFTRSPMNAVTLVTGETIRFFDFRYVALVAGLHSVLIALFGIYACFRVIKVVRAERQITAA